MATVKIEFDGGRKIKWDVKDDTAVMIAQSLVHGMGPAEEDD